MSANLRRYLIEEYESRRNNPYVRRVDERFPIQIDDQDDSDNINEFCNIFCYVKKKYHFVLEFSGNFSITPSMKDLADIYNGYIDQENERFSLSLKIDQIEAVMDLADRIRKTARNTDHHSATSWLAMSARTISSLYRFVRIIKEYTNSRSLRKTFPG